MKKQSRLTAFSARWLEMPNYASWLKKKNEFTALCKFCLVDITIKYEGVRGLEKHLRTKRHQNIVRSNQISGSVSKFMVRESPNTEEILIAKAELLTIFHNIKHGLSYNSLDCHSKLEKSVFPDSKIAAKITCGRTKSSAIARNVLGPFAQEQVVLDLKRCYYFAIGNDASSIGNVKYFAYTVQYFDANTGICKKILDFYEDDNSKSNDIHNKIKQINDNFHLSIDQISAFSADNAAVNYGINNSVYQKLLLENKNILKANCNCHVINNCVKVGISCLSIDIENIVIKIFNEFSSSSCKTKKLKECFEFTNMEYKSLLRHVPTRWLSLLPAIDRLLLDWPAIKRYFLLKKKENCRRELWDFVARGISNIEIMNENEECFEEGISEAYLYFAQNVLHDFHVAIKVLESDSCTIVEVDTVMEKLRIGLKNRLNDNFFGNKANTLMRKMNPNDKDEFKQQVELFLTKTLNYLEAKYDYGENSIMKQLSLFCIKTKLCTWTELNDVISNLNICDDINCDELYTEYCSLRNIYDNLPKDIPNDKIWSHFFSKYNENEMKNMKKIISFIFSIPISNAFCEKVFSLFNNLFSKERNKMLIDLIKAELLIRQNLSENCNEFIKFLNTEKGMKLANALKSNNKYRF